MSNLLQNCLSLRSLPQERGAAPDSTFWRTSAPGEWMIKDTPLRLGNHGGRCGGGASVQAAPLLGGGGGCASVPDQAAPRRVWRRLGGCYNVSVEEVGHQ